MTELSAQLMQKLSQEIFTYMRHSPKEFVEAFDLQIEDHFLPHLYQFAGFAAVKIDIIIAKIFEDLQQLEEK